MSEQYIVSARKYRPQTFGTVIGQSHITTTLKNAIVKQQLAHAYLFCGPRGVGKTTCARILARTINCEQPTEDMEACGKCTTCVSFNDNASFNIFELDAASNNSVDDIRALTEQVRYAPQAGKYKIYIIDEVHMLSSQAFNAFLKTLEEPPAYAIFILATTEKHKILPTILSRCQIFDFKRIQTSDITEHLAGICQKESVQYTDAALHIIAQKSEGCMRDALSMMDRIAGFTNGNLSYEQTVEHLNILDADVYFKLSTALLSKDISSALIILDDVLQRGFEGDVIMNGFSEYYRNLLLCKDIRMAKLLDVPEEHKRIYFESSKIISSAYILSALSLLNDAEINYKTALNKRLHVEINLMKLAYINDLVSAENVEMITKKKAIELDSSETSSLMKQFGGLSEMPNSLAQPPSHADMANQEEPVSKQTVETSYPSELLELPKSYDSNNHSTVQVEVEQEMAVPKRPKIGMSLLNSLHHSAELKSDKKQITIDQQVVEDLLKEYCHHLRTVENQAVKAEQMTMMKATYLPPDEIQLLCISSVNMIVAENARLGFLDFCKNKTGQNQLRIIAQIDPNAVMAEAIETEKAKSNIETFQILAEKNPMIQTLKDTLNLVIL